MVHGHDYVTDGSFEMNILKKGKLPAKERIAKKLEILQLLKQRGIWLLDVSFMG